MPRRPWIPVLLAGAVVGAAEAPLPFSFTNVAAQAGLDAVTVFGGTDKNRYLLETTGCGAAFFDFDADGRLDVFLVNGTTLEGFPKGKEPVNHLYRNRGDGGFEDVTSRSGLGASGWGQGVCAGDYDNDGFEDLFVTYYGQDRLYRNRGDGTFTDVTAKAGMLSRRTRWGVGCAFVDYDRDGKLDVFAANYIDMDLKTAPTPDSGLCRYKGIPVACGPPGLTGGKNVLWHNRGDGTFEDVSDKAGITRNSGTYGLGVSTIDFDDDGWTDLYVANDSNPAALYRNNRDGTFTDVAVTSGCAYSQDGKPQAGMGVAVGDYDRNGTMDVLKTNFAGDTSTLYSNSGQGFCEDRTFASGMGVHTRWLGWGAALVDLDNDGWLDAFLVNGHVYPEVAQIKTEAAYQQRKVVYRNLGGGRFEEVGERLGPPAATPKAGRGAAFGDYDNDGDVDVVVNNVHDTPDLFRTEAAAGNHWLAAKLVGTRSNRSAIGARVRCEAGGVTQWQEVRGGGSYASQNDLRVHFGLAGAASVDRLWVRWPNGLEEEWTGLPADRIHTLTEGSGRPAATGGEVIAMVAVLALLVQQPAPPEPQPAAPPDAAAAVARARALISEDKPLVAVEALQAFRGARDPDVELAAGVAYYHAGEAVRAVETLAPVVSRLPAESLGRREAVQVLGLANYLAGRIADAIPYLEQTRALAPGNTELAYALGMAYIQTRQPEKARATWSAAFGVGADTAAAHVLNAQMMVRAELDEMAEAELKLALAKDPRLPHANFLLGQTALFRGRLDDAVALLKKELEVNPASAMAFYRLGDAYVRQQQWDPAVAALQKSVWLNPFFSGPYILLGQAYSKKGDLAAAEGMLRRAADYDPNNKAAHYLLGQLLRQTGRLDEARRELEIAAKLPGMSER